MVTRKVTQFKQSIPNLYLESTRLKNSGLSVLSALPVCIIYSDRDVFPSTNRVHWSQDYSFSGIIESGSCLKTSINSYLAKFDERF